MYNRHLTCIKNIHIIYAYNSGKKKINNVTTNNNQTKRTRNKNENKKKSVFDQKMCDGNFLFKKMNTHLTFIKTIRRTHQ